MSLTLPDAECSQVDAPRHVAQVRTDEHNEWRHISCNAWKYNKEISVKVNVQNLKL